jgi:hypothetical protein
MIKKGKNSKSTRAPRIRVPNREKALFIVDTEKLVGVIQRLSLTGGSVILAKGCVPHGAMGQIGLNTVFGKVSAHIEFLHNGAEGIPLAQAFRFVSMSDISSRRYAAAVEQMRNAGFSDAQEEESKSLTDVAVQTFMKLHNGLSGMISSGRRTKA